MPTDPTSWQVLEPENHNNTVPTYHIEHDTAKLDKRSGKPRRATKIFKEPGEAAVFYERMKDDERNPRGWVAYVHRF